LQYTTVAIYQSNSESRTTMTSLQTTMVNSNVAWS